MQSLRVCARTVALSSSRISVSNASSGSIRLIHATATAYKAKSKKVIETDDLFGSLESEDLFATETTEVDSTPSEPASPSKTSKPSAKIDYAKRFQEKLKFLSERNGKSPAVHDGKQVRDSIWLHLIGNATTQEDLEKVAEQFRPWKDSGREIKPRVIDLFVVKCSKLGCPQFALHVFSNHVKYGLALDRTSGRHLLHGLHMRHALSDSITLASLYGVYRLRGLSTDPVACSMLAAACFREAQKDANKEIRDNARLVAKALLPSLQQSLAKLQTVEVMKAKKMTDREISWLRWTMKKIEIAVVKSGWNSSWLREFRTANDWGDEGHATLREKSRAEVPSAS